MPSQYRQKLEQTIQKLRSYEEVIRAEELYTLYNDEDVVNRELKEELKLYCHMAVLFLENNLDLKEILTDLSKKMLGDKYVEYVTVEFERKKRDFTKVADDKNPLASIHPPVGITAKPIDVTDVTLDVTKEKKATLVVDGPPVAKVLPSLLGKVGTVTCTEGIENKSHNSQLKKIGPYFKVKVVVDEGERLRVMIVEPGVPNEQFYIPRDDLEF